MTQTTVTKTVVIEDEMHALTLTQTEDGWTMTDETGRDFSHHIVKCKNNSDCDGVATISYNIGTGNGLCQPCNDKLDIAAVRHLDRMKATITKCLACSEDVKQQSNHVPVGYHVNCYPKAECIEGRHIVLRIQGRYDSKAYPYCKTCHSCGAPYFELSLIHISEPTRPY